MNSMYIHIPFCSSICTYCAFTKFYYKCDMVEKYLKSLKKEIELNYKGEVLKTIYIGGGTPSCLNLNELTYLFDMLKDKLILFKNNKVNRISIGIESTISKNLNYLGRKYDFNLVKDKIKLIKSVGFDNINIDLIYALPTESLKELEIDLDNILSLNCPHISTYSLMIEENTILGIKKEKSISEDMDYEMYKLICKKLIDNGYIHYEVSNFSKDKYQSRHNLVYWNNDHYYGFGLGAAGYIENIRYKNTTSLKEYNKKNFIKEKEILSIKDQISYELILGFRKIDGINKSMFKKKYGIDIYSLYNIRDLLKSGDLKENNENIFINYDKIYIENQILMNFVGE